MSRDVYEAGVSEAGIHEFERGFSIRTFWIPT